MITTSNSEFSEDSRNQAIAAVNLLRDRFVGLKAEEGLTLIAAALGGLPTLLLGPHGTGKTSLAKMISGFFFQKFRTIGVADDLLSFAGIVNVEALKTGKLEFSIHDRSLLSGVDSLLIDEINRGRSATGDMALMLEVLEERSLLGFPLTGLKNGWITATANETGLDLDGGIAGGAYDELQFDPALRDRFSVVIPIGDSQSLLTAGDFARIAKINLQNTGFAKSQETTLGELRSEFLNARETLLGDDELVDAVTQFSGRLAKFLVDYRPAESKNLPYISPRTLGRNVPQVAMSVLSYRALMTKGEIIPTLIADCALAVEYAVTHKHQLPAAVMHQAQTFAKYPLVSFVGVRRSKSDPLSGLETGTVLQRVQSLETLLPQISLFEKLKTRALLLIANLIRDVFNLQALMVEPETSILKTNLLGRIRRALATLSTRDITYESLALSLENEVLTAKLAQMTDDSLSDVSDSSYWNPPL